MKLARYIRLTRPLNCLMAAFATLIGYSVAAGAVSFPLQVILAMGAAFLVCAGGQAANDYFDAEIDRRIRPEKPIPSGAMPRYKALGFAVVLFLLGDALAFGVNEVAFTIALVFSLLLCAYSAFMGRAKHFGNWVVAFGMGFTLVFGASVVGRYEVAAWLALAAVLAGVPREIIKDIEDMEADIEKMSLPKAIGKRKSAAVACVLYAGAVAAAAYVFAAGLFGGYMYISLVAVSAIMFACSAFLAFGKGLHTAQLLSKAGMVVALLAFLAGVFE